MQDLRLDRRHDQTAHLPGFPPMLQAASDRSAGALLAWTQQHAPAVRAQLHLSGALLLRGYELTRAQDFAQVATQLGGPLGQHYEGPSPRKQLAEGVYNASEVPSGLVVPEHAEMSYLQQMPRYLFFWCRVPAAHGGETTLVDARRLLARLDPGRIEPLVRGPLRIRRRHARPHGLHDPFELQRWPQSFGTHDRAELLARAEGLGFRARFTQKGALTLEHEQPAVRTHPETGERAWLNHLLVFHASSPAALLRSAVLQSRSLRAAPLYPLALAYRLLAPRIVGEVATDVVSHDGSPIPEATLAHIRAAVERETTALAWQAGDLLMVDNHLALHGRRPFRGARDVIVAWSSARA